MLRRLKAALERAPVAGPAFGAVRGWLRRRRFGSSAGYWERRYQKGRTSGPGSYSQAARFKAEVLNAFVREKGIRSVVEFGCGDGGQLSLAEYPRYVGVDVSRTAVDLCKRKFGGDPTKAFYHSSALPAAEALRAELALSLEVVFHLVEDEVFRDYMARLFGAAERYVVIFSSNLDEPGRYPHVRHRNFGAYVEQHFPAWRLLRKIETPRPAGGEDARKAPVSDFYIYERR